jgi:hypothetical protein
MGPVRCALMERLPTKLALRAWIVNQVMLGHSECATRAHLEHANLAAVPPAKRVGWVALVPKASVMRVSTVRRLQTFDTSASIVPLVLQGERDSVRSVRVDAPRTRTALSVFTVNLGTLGRAVSVLNAHLEQNPTQIALLVRHAKHWERIWHERATASQSAGHAWQPHSHRRMQHLASSAVV